MKDLIKEQGELKSAERRRFMEVSAKFGFTAATVALFSGVILRRKPWPKLPRKKMCVKKQPSTP